MIIQYNGIVLPYAATTRFDKTAVPDPSNTDLILQRYDIDVVVTLNYRYMAAILQDELAADDLPNTTAAACAVRIADQLMERRKILGVTFNGFDMIPGGMSASREVDSANGPIPQYCRYTDMGNETFLFQYGIVAHYYEITDPETLENLPGRTPVVYNRWKETVTLDDTDAAVRVREGSFRIRSDPSTPVTPDMLRSQMAVLSIPTGFLRTASRYSLSEDGLTLSYSITDKESFKNPPSPAFRARGYYRETALGVGGVVKYGECRTQLWGASTNGSQVNLLETAIAVCVGKLDIVGAPLGAAVTKTGTILLHAITEVNHYENQVDVLIKVQIPIGTKRFGGRDLKLAGLTDKQTQVPLSEALPGLSLKGPSTPTYRNYGQAGILLQAAAYFDPAAGNAALVAGQQFVGNVLGAGRLNTTIPIGNTKVTNQGPKPGQG